MTDWAMGVCTMFGPETSAAVSVACVVLVVLVIAAVVLGFGPLRGRLGGPSSRPTAGAELDSGAGLVSIWRLHHHLNRAGRRPTSSRFADLTTGDRTNLHRNSGGRPWT